VLQGIPKTKTLRDIGIRYIELVNEITAPLPPLPIAEMSSPPWTPPSSPLEEATVMLVSSAGVHFRSDPPFAPVDDLSFRCIPVDTPAALLRPSHPSPIRRPGLIDINVVHPAERLSELAAGGRIGAVADHHQSMLGAIKSLVQLVTELGPAMAADAVASGATVVMLVPLCPACHQTIGLLARVFERAGLTTVTVTGARDITERVRPPRAGWLDFPLGNSVGRPNEPDEQRAICLDVLGLATSAASPGAIANLSYQWPDPTWEDRIVQQYRDEADTVVSQRRHEFDASGAHFAADEVAAVESMGRRGLL
jgi:D-proline reductase (dithiol) PrdB